MQAEAAVSRDYGDECFPSFDLWSKTISVGFVAKQSSGARKTSLGFFSDYSDPLINLTRFNMFKWNAGLKSGEPKTIGFRFPMASWFDGAPCSSTKNNLRTIGFLAWEAMASCRQGFQVAAPAEPASTHQRWSNELNDVKEFSKICAKMWRLGCWILLNIVEWCFSYFFVTWWPLHWKSFHAQSENLQTPTNST